MSIEELNEKEGKVLAALMSSFTHKEACQKLGITEQALYLYLRNDKFQVAYRQARNQAVEHAGAMLAKMVGNATWRAHEILRDETAKKSEQLNAAKLILEYGFKFYEFENVIERLKKLETTLEMQNQKAKEDD
jgi:hypothetical protein